MAEPSKLLPRLFAAFLVLGMVPWPQDAAAQELRPGAPIDIVIDKAQLMRLPERVATIVIGNPLIADASLQAGGLMVLTGKGYGATNLVALDRKGQVLLEKTVQVLGPEQDIVVYKGVNRETYSCTPECQPRIMLGDGMQYFSQTLAQTTTRATQATATNSR